MATSFDLAFVDSIAAAPNTRLNLNSDTITTLADDTDFGMPELQRAVASTLLADGAVVPSSAYGNRTITLALNFPEANLDNVASRLQSLARELDRQTNILRYRPGTSAPVFFLTFRSSMASVVWDAVEQRALVSLYAEPFALGLREDISLVTVNNDPAAGSNGLFVDFTGIKGDVETPALIKFGGLSGGVFADIIIGTRRHGTPSSMPMFFQAESLTAGVDTSAPGADATMSGSGSSYMRTTFSTLASMTPRLSTTNFPVASGIDQRGTYRLYAMLRGPAGGATFSIQWLMAPSSSSSASVTSDVTTFTPTSTQRQLIDLGQITFPIGTDPVTEGYSGVEKTLTGAYLALQASRSGAGNLDWDYLVLVPDDPARGDDYFTFSLYNLATNKDVIADGPRDMVYACDFAANTMPVWYPIPSSGRIPHLSPNVTNRWVMLRPDRAGVDVNYGDVKTRTTTVTVSYWPRYAYVRPVLS